MILCADRMAKHMQTNVPWNLLHADNTQNRTFMFPRKENVGIQEVRCISYDYFFYSDIHINLSVPETHLFIPVICCQAVTATCEACKAGIDVDEYCTQNPNMQGC